MPICTSCKHNREIERLRKICAACPGASCNFGKDVHIDAAADPMLVYRHADTAILSVIHTPTLSMVNLEPKVLDAVERIVAEFSTVGDTQAPLIVRKLRGETNQQIADGMGLSKQVVWERWHNLTCKNPIWSALENGLQGKRGGGQLTHKPKPDGTDAQQAADNGGAQDGQSA